MNNFGLPILGRYAYNSVRTIGSKLRECILPMLLVVAMATGIACLPHKVEGTYYAGALISCLCHSTHYLRFHKGKVLSCATFHEPAELLGRYEEESNGDIVVYMTPFKSDEPERILFSITNHQVGFAAGRLPDEGNKFLLVRAFPFGSSFRTIALQEAKVSQLNPEGVIVSRFYDRDLNLIRSETVPRPDRRMRETAVPPVPDP